MPITVYEHAIDFLAAAEKWLLQYEVANALMIGVATRVARSTEGSNAVPFFATIADADGRLIGAAVMTPPHNVILSMGIPPSALSDLIAVLCGDDWPVPGVIGPDAEARAFVAAWTSAAGRTSWVGMRQRVYELRTVTPPPRRASGRLRSATLADIDVIAAWMDAFMHEAVPDDPPGDSRPTAERLIEAGDIVIWEDGKEAVSMAARTRPAGRGTSVNLVYTPPRHRCNGYASSCVAALSQQCLDMGFAYCTLFTDLDNPTSNSIYTQIGYKPVCDFSMMRFGEDNGTGRGD